MKERCAVGPTQRVPFTTFPPFHYNDPYHQGDPSEGTSIEFVGELLEHPIAKQLMVQERLVELAKKVRLSLQSGRLVK